MFHVSVGAPTLVYAAPVNEATKAWGVYSIPKLWRLPSGELVVRFNGIKDVPGSPRLCPDLYFFSSDEGNTWSGPTDRGNIEISILGGVDFPYLKLKNGQTLAILPSSDPCPVKGMAPVHTFPIPNSPKDSYDTYRQGDLTREMFSMERVLYARDGTQIDRKPAKLLFDEREIMLIGMVNGEKIESPLSYHNCCGSPWISSLCEAEGGTLFGLVTGHNPAVAGQYSGEAYLVASEDGGLTWKCRANITKNSGRYPFGLCGDGQEASLALGPDGTLYCVTRTNMSIGYEMPGVTMETMLFISHDGGFTWEDERPIADSSVTPHVIALKNGALAVIYGRPGVHMIVSEDGGRTFSTPYSLIGTIRAEEKAAGKSFSEMDRFDVSYSNSFYTMLDEESFLVLYSDMSCDPGDGLCHKAGVVRKIRISADGEG